MINFGRIAVGTTASFRTILVMNQYGNSDPLAIGQVSIGGSGSFAIVPSVTTCTIGNSMPPAGQCQIGVMFAPTAPGGQSGSITIVDNATNSRHSITLVGTGF
jgi:hypothetical protein